MQVRTEDRAPTSRAEDTVWLRTTHLTLALTVLGPDSRPPYKTARPSRLTRFSNLQARLTSRAQAKPTLSGEHMPASQPQTIAMSNLDSKYRASTPSERSSRGNVVDHDAPHGKS